MWKTDSQKPGESAWFIQLSGQRVGSGLSCSLIAHVLVKVGPPVTPSSRRRISEHGVSRPLEIRFGRTTILAAGNPEGFGILSEAFLEVCLGGDKCAAAWGSSVLNQS